MLRSGDKIGPYTLIRKLGKGAFGEVWLVEEHDAILSSQFALKILFDEDADLEVVKQEATVWLQASGHPNVLPIHKAAVYDGQFVIVSEYAPDGSLKDWLKKHSGKAPSINETIRITVGILAGLEHLHKRRIIHRDIKPDNVLMHGNTPRLADFGLSRTLKSTVHSRNLAGTPPYMAPEVFRGERDEQTDVWAVGVMLYQLVCGRLPFPEADLYDVMNQVANTEPQPLGADVPESLQKVIVKALEKEKAQRYQSASQMREALQEAQRQIEETEGNRTSQDRALFVVNPAELPIVRLVTESLAISTVLEEGNVAETILGTIALLRQEAAQLFDNERYAEAAAKWQEVLRFDVNHEGIADNIRDAEQRLRESQDRKAQGSEGQKLWQTEELKAPATISDKPQTQPIVKSKRLLWLIGGVMLIVMVVLAVMIFNNKPKNTNSPTSLTPTQSPTASEIFSQIESQMVQINGGTFLMGSPNSEQGRPKNEGPQHQVTVSSFYMGKYEVTLEQWKAIESLPKLKIALDNYSWFQGDHLPKTGVSWEEAVEFCARLSQATGKKYRLPTEAEWEYACRAGTTEPFYYPVNWMAWYGEDSKGSVHAVGQKKENQFGLYDMSGNVFEWCQDWFSENYYAQSPKVNPVGPGSGSNRVMRGGSFDSSESMCRSAFRGSAAPWERPPMLGFRLVKSNN